MANFKHKDELYVLEYAKMGQKQQVGEMSIKMPRMPEERFMLNYDLSSKDQKLKKRVVPSDLQNFKQRDLDYFVEAEWHRRLNGYWALIKGDPYYIPGGFDFFMNYWTTQRGQRPDFRFQQLQWWWFWQNVERDPDSFGMYIVKCRRLGETELALSALQERTSRYKSVNGGMIHISETGVKKNFRRLINGYAKLPFWFRPITSGSLKPKGLILDFDLPNEQVTKKGLKEGRYTNIEQGLESKIEASPAYTLAFDGDWLLTYFADEIFKVKSSKLDVLKQHENIRRVTSLNNEEVITGKSILMSTVEEMENPKPGELSTVDIAKKLWDQSDPNDRNELGRTTSGLYRLFRGYDRAAKCDEWGFPMVEQAKKARNIRIAEYREKKLFDKLLALYRKSPSSVKEAFSAELGDRILFPELCMERLTQLDRKIDINGNAFTPRGEFGDLIWKGNIFGGDVEWVRNSSGRWFISQHPDIPNNYVVRGGKKWPAAMAYFRMGVDPYDSAMIAGTGSEGGFTVKKRMDLSIEDGVIIDGNGEIMNPEIMRTNQIVCDYLFRHNDPFSFYEDAYKTMIYYGVASFPETTKDAFRTWMYSKDLGQWLQVIPEPVQSTYSGKDTTGMPATERNIDIYIDALKLHISKFIWCCHHPRVIDQWMNFSRKDRTKYDLAVASGYTEVADIDHRYNKKEEAEGWDEDYGERYYEN